MAFDCSSSCSLLFYYFYSSSNHIRSYGVHLLFPHHTVSGQPSLKTVYQYLWHILTDVSLLLMSFLYDNPFVSPTRTP